MEIIKKAILVCLLLFASVWALNLIIGSTLIIPITKPEPNKAFELQKGNIINPLKSFDFNTGNWVAYLVISRSDFESLPATIRKARCLKIKDIKALKQLQSEWNFVYTGGDMATIESEIYFFNNGKLVLKSGIVLNKESIGLQNRDYGYLEPKDSTLIIESFKEFKKVYLPTLVSTKSFNIRL